MNELQRLTEQLELSTRVYGVACDIAGGRLLVWARPIHINERVIGPERRVLAGSTLGNAAARHMCGIAETRRPIIDALMPFGGSNQQYTELVCRTRTGSSVYCVTDTWNLKDLGYAGTVWYEVYTSKEASQWSANSIISV